MSALVKANVPIGEKGIILGNIDELFRFAQAVAGSALAPKGFDKAESIMVAIQMGMEVGLSPMAALQNIAVINGRPTIWGDAQMAVVRNTGLLTAYCEMETNNEIEPLFRELQFVKDAKERLPLLKQLAIKQASMKRDALDFGVSVYIERKDYDGVFGRFTVQDAMTAGLWKKQGPWTQYPARMLKFRARSFALRDQFGDALKGMMSAEEARDIEPEVQPGLVGRTRRTARMGGAIDTVVRTDDPPAPSEPSAAEEFAATAAANLPVSKEYIGYKFQDGSSIAMIPPHVPSVSYLQKTPMFVAPTSEEAEVMAKEWFNNNPIVGKEPDEPDPLDGYLPDLDNPSDSILKLMELSAVAETQVINYMISKQKAKAGQEILNLADSKLKELCTTWKSILPEIRKQAA